MTILFQRIEFNAEYRSSIMNVYGGYYISVFYAVSAELLQIHLNSTPLMLNSL